MLSAGKLLADHRARSLADAQDDMGGTYCDPSDAQDDIGRSIRFFIPC